MRDELEQTTLVHGRDLGNEQALLEKCHLADCMTFVDVDVSMT